MVQDNAFLLIGLIEGGVPNTDRGSGQCQEQAA